MSKKSKQYVVVVETLKPFDLGKGFTANKHIRDKKFDRVEDAMMCVDRIDDMINAGEPYTLINKSGGVTYIYPDNFRQAYIKTVKS